MYGPPEPQPRASRIGSWLVPFSAEAFSSATHHKNRHIKFCVCSTFEHCLELQLGNKALDCIIPIESNLLITSQSASILSTGVEQSWEFQVVVSRGELLKLARGDKKARG